MKSRKNFSLIIFLLFTFCFFQNCNQNKKVNSENNPITKTNIRFASKKENYKELTSAKRLVTNKTEVTSQYFQMEGPAWENENVAFRNYFDARNGIDIFGKRHSEMVLDSVGIDENYHELQSWGMDILKVGNSLGAGGLGMIIGDSLFRIGETGTGTYQLISEGKNASSFKLIFENCTFHNRNYKVIHEIKIGANTHYYESKIIVEGLQGDEILVSGIVAHLDSLANGVSKNHLYIATHGAQALEGGNLGMALATPTNQFVKTSKATDYKGTIDNTHLLEMKPINSIVEFLFFAGWELQDAKFQDENYFKKVVKEELHQVN